MPTVKEPDRVKGGAGDPDLQTQAGAPPVATTTSLAVLSFSLPVPLSPLAYFYVFPGVVFLPGVPPGPSPQAYLGNFLLVTF